ncbi:MAG: hypothetical protein JWM80_1654, partial [Cyanobacteria bacterium RYN_339]|nr:hypothetical protein [Cyanobacteria bacterium RYN_339]
VRWQTPRPIDVPETAEPTPGVRVTPRPTPTRTPRPPKHTPKPTPMTHTRLTPLAPHATPKPTPKPTPRPAPTHTLAPATPMPTWRAPEPSSDPESLPQMP